MVFWHQRCKSWGELLICARSQYSPDQNIVYIHEPFLFRVCLTALAKPSQQLVDGLQNISPLPRSPQFTLEVADGSVLIIILWVLDTGEDLPLA